jgi:hypothetical protein
MNDVRREYSMEILIGDELTYLRFGVTPKGLDIEVLDIEECDTPGPLTTINSDAPEELANLVPIASMYFSLDDGIRELDRVVRALKAWRGDASERALSRISSLGKDGKPVYVVEDFNDEAAD